MYYKGSNPLKSCQVKGNEADSKSAFLIKLKTYDRLSEVGTLCCMDDDCGSGQKCIFYDKRSVSIMP